MPPSLRRGVCILLQKMYLHWITSCPSANTKHIHSLSCASKPAEETVPGPAPGHGTEVATLAAAMHPLDSDTLSTKAHFVLN